MNAPTPLPLSPSRLAVRSLEVADGLLKIKDDLQERAEYFSNSVNEIMGCSDFSKAAAEEAAEIIKIEATRRRHLWGRLGINSGTYFAFAIPVFTVFALSSNKANSWIPALLSGIAFVALFLAGSVYDEQQNRYQIAESILKVASKRNEVIPVYLRESSKVGERIKSEDRRMITSAVGALVVIGLIAIVVLQINSHQNPIPSNGALRSVLR